MTRQDESVNSAPRSPMVLARPPLPAPGWPPLDLMWANHQCWPHGAGTTRPHVAVSTVRLVVRGTLQVESAEGRHCAMAGQLLHLPPLQDFALHCQGETEWWGWGWRWAGPPGLEDPLLLLRHGAWRPEPAHWDALCRGAALLQAHARPADGAHQLLRAGACAMLLGQLAISCAMPDFLERAAAGRPPWLERVLAHLETHPESRVAQLAQVAGFSPSQFRRNFAAATGLSPRAYVQALRLARARRRVETEDTPLAVIADECGVSSRGQFACQFQRAFGLTPSKARALARETVA